LAKCPSFVAAIVFQLHLVKQGFSNYGCVILGLRNKLA